MSGPWEKYQKQNQRASGPWTKYATQGQRAVANPKLRQRVAEGMRDFKGQNVFPNGLAESVLDGATGAVASLIENPIDSVKRGGKTFIVDPLANLAKLPANLTQGMGGNYEATKARQLGDAQSANFWQNFANESNLEGSIGLVELAGLIPALKGPSNSVKNAMGAKAVTPSVQALATGAPPNPTIEAMMRMANQEGIRPEDLINRAKMAADNPQEGELLFQALDTQQTAQRLGNRSGASRGIMQNAVREQKHGQASRVQSAFNDAFDSPEFDLSEEAITQRYSGLGSQMYDEAFNQAPRASEKFQKVTVKPAILSRLESLGNDLARDGVDAADDIVKNPGKAMQEIKFQLDDEISKALRKDGAKRKASRLIALRNELVDGIEEAYPGYKDANKFWSGVAGDEDALSFGQNVFKTNYRDVAKEAAGYSQSQKDNYLAGVIRAIEDKLDNPETHSALRREFKQPSFKKKLANFMPENKIDGLFEKLDREAYLAETGGAADYARGSRTAPLAELQSIEMAANTPLRRMTGQAANYISQNGASPLNAISDLAKRVGQRGVDALNAPDETTLTEIALLLSKPSRDGAQELLRLNPSISNNSIGKTLNRFERKREIEALLAKLSTSQAPRGLPLYAAAVSADTGR